MNAYCYVLVPRIDAESNMDAHRSYVRRKAENEAGVLVAERLHCRFSAVGSNELVLHAMRGAELSHRVYFVDNPNLREENRIELNGVQYILVGVPQNPSQVGRLWQLDVRAITHQNEIAAVLE